MGERKQEPTMGQSELGDYGGGSRDDHRPTAAEAAAVAGNGTQQVTVDTDDRRFPPVDERVELAVMQVDYRLYHHGGTVSFLESNAIAEAYGHQTGIIEHHHA